jgi:hypothetical protein
LGSTAAGPALKTTATAAAARKEDGSLRVKIIKAKLQLLEKDKDY